MTELVVVAQGAVSALGRGAAAVTPATLGAAASSAIGRDAALTAGGLERPFAARAELTGAVHDDRATALILCAMDQVASELDVQFSAWRGLRIGLCLGTSSGGMISAEQFFDRLRSAKDLNPERALSATYFAPFDAAKMWLRAATGERPVEPHMQVVAACASSTLAIGMGMRWLQRDACDLVLAGGYDAISQFVAAGFEKIRATSGTLPKPFREGRDGMALGEGAGVVAITTHAQSRVHGLHQPGFALSGFGASCDAVHITAPDRSGEGLRRAAEAALDDAADEVAHVDLVSAHGTATSFNDAMESKAIAASCSGPVPYVHAFKAQIGHTLGAAGVLEVLAATGALRDQVVPPTCGDGPLAEDAPAKIVDWAQSAPLGRVLKLSAAFGGVTAALVADARPRAGDAVPTRSDRPVRLVRSITVEDVDRAVLARRCGMPRDRIARIDPLGQLTLAATAELVCACGREAVGGAGIVSGHALATLETNRRFYERLVAKGPRWVDPRMFPATSPNAGVGHGAIVYGLHGPCFSVCGGLAGGIEAVVAAAELVRAGDVERMIVVAADDDGPAIRAWLELAAGGRPYAPGAVALLLEAGSDDPHQAIIPPDLRPDHGAGAIGQLGLREWLSSMTAL